MILRQYQLDGVEQIRQQFRQGSKRPLFCLATAGGKTVVADYIISSSAAKGGRPVFLAARRELVHQASNRLSTPHGVIMSGDKRTNADAPVQVCSIQSLLTRELPFTPTLIFLDECFPAGTLIDGRPIESIKIGEFVSSYNHKTCSLESKKVTWTFKKRPALMCRIYLEGGGRIDSTQEHPFFTGNSYKPAIQLERGDELLTDEAKDLLNLRGSFHAKVLELSDDAVLFEGVREDRYWQTQESRIRPMQDMRYGSGAKGEERTRASHKQSSTLLRQMQERDHGGCSNEGGSVTVSVQQDIRFRAYEVKQPNAVGRESVEDVRYAEADQSSPKDSGRKRDRAFAMRGSYFQSTPSFIGRSAKSSFSSGYEESTRERLSVPLQNRPNDTLLYGGDRDRRGLSLLSQEAVAGQEKAGPFGVVRVDRVEVLKPTSDGTFGGVCGDGYVYNIEVEDNNNYFANGVLVHNCHHSTAATHQKLLSRFPDVPVVGLSATPVRNSGLGLGDYFTSLVSGPGIEHLMDMGFLVRPRHLVGPQQDGPAKTLFSDPVQMWFEHAKGQRTMAFCSSVEESIKLAARFNFAGVPAVHVDGTTDAEIRDAIPGRIERGEILVVTNYAVWTEGVDIPSITCVILDRSTSSIAVYLQACGRGLRSHPGKTHCVILDHGSNIYTHGRIDQNRHWQLTKGRDVIAGPSTPDVADDIRVCPTCFTVAPPNSTHCQCGYKFFIKKRKTYKHKPGTLELHHDDGRITEIAPSRQESDYKRFLGEQRNGKKKDGTPFSPQYARFRFMQTYGFPPRKEWAQPPSGPPSRKT